MKPNMCRSAPSQPVSQSEVGAVVNDAEPFEQFLPSFVGADLHMVGSILVGADPGARFRQ